MSQGAVITESSQPYLVTTGSAGEVVVAPTIVAESLTAVPPAGMDGQPKLCRLDDPDCEACQ